MKIYLIGLPGCGKSTIGRKLAKQLNMPFFDLDKVIVEKERLSINELFKQKGEPYFRQREAEALRAVSRDNERALIATGGGAPCFFDNMDFINAHGLSVFLDVPCSIIISRLLAGGVEDRPLLKDIPKEKLIAELEEKRNFRISYYQQAKLVFKGEDIKTEEIEKEIKKALEG
jgi:shikimate kinase